MKRNNYPVTLIEFFTSHKVLVKSHYTHFGSNYTIKPSSSFLSSLFYFVIFLFITYTIIKSKFEKIRHYTKTKNFISFVIKYPNTQTTFINHYQGFKNVRISILGNLILHIKLINAEVLHTTHYSNLNRAS